MIFLHMVISWVGVSKMLLRVPLVTMIVNSQSCWLKYGRKFSYIGHRRFLDSNHKFCKQKQSFDGHVDTRSAPITVSKGEIMLQMNVVSDHVFGKKTVNFSNKIKGWEEALTVWKKRSIFFTLLY